MLRECASSEDEANCKCGDFLKAQLLYHKICDGTPDCWDYSDETDCGSFIEIPFVGFDKKNIYLKTIIKEKRKKKNLF